MVKMIASSILVIVGLLFIIKSDSIGEFYLQGSRKHHSINYQVMKDGVKDLEKYNVVLQGLVMIGLGAFFIFS